MESWLPVSTLRWLPSAIKEPGVGRTLACPIQTRCQQVKYSRNGWRKANASDVTKVFSSYLPVSWQIWNQLALSLHRKNMFHCVRGSENYGVFATPENQLQTNSSRSLRFLDSGLESSMARYPYRLSNNSNSANTFSSTNSLHHLFSSAFVSSG